MLQPSNTLVVICGPTASGKTALSIEIAKHFNCSIISADSRQFYKEIPIGTAAPSAMEIAEVPHFFVADRSIHHHLNAGEFANEATTILTSLFTESPVQVACGGSGLYLKALTEGLSDALPSNEFIRAEIQEMLKSEGLLSIQRLLLSLDENAFSLVAMDNPQRVVRAIELIKLTGEKLEDLFNQKTTEPPFKSIFIGLTPAREVLYQRINHRVDQMLVDGLLNEVKSVYALKELKSLQTVGYKEIFSFLDNEISFEEAIELIKRNTRRFAKRQITWFKHQAEVEWFTSNQIDPILNYLNQKIYGNQQ